MGKSEKRLERVKQNPRNVSLTEFESLINEFGYIEEGNKHPRAIIGAATLPYARRNPVRVCYVKQLIHAIENR
jgi:hypothetical protein